MAYDAALGRVVLFGGYGDGGFLSDTWVWDGLNWTQEFPATTPPARQGSTLVYDAAHQQVLMFGGVENASNGYLNDTWVWNGTNWLQLAPQNSPSPRDSYQIAYDKVRQQAVLFGGYNNVHFLGDTWIWDGTNWYAMTPSYSPPARELSSLVFDEAHGEAVLFGGLGGSPVVAFNDTWTWLGGTTPSSPETSTFGPVGPNNPQGTYAEPVSTGNGNYFYQHTDFRIAGRGMPVVFQRSYNTLDNYSGPLGANWTHSYNIVLTQTSTGAVIKWGDGHGETYTLSGGVYAPPPGSFSALIKNPDGTFVLTQKNQTRQLFAGGGMLTSIVDRNGNTILLTYNGAGNLTQITDPVGRNLTFSYDGSDRITQITDPVGRAVTFSYSGTNDLTGVTDPVGGVTQFAYDASHHVTSVTLPNSQTLLQNTYDSAGRVITQTNGRGFTTTLAYDTPSPGSTTITDARGKNTVHSYDASLRITTITDPLGGVVGYAYDANNERTSITNQNAKATTFAYDGNGNVTGITDPLGDSSAFTYDVTNNLLTATNAKGKTTTFSYDAKGNLQTILDALGNSTTFAYDGSGQLRADATIPTHPQSVIHHYQSGRSRKSGFRSLHRYQRS